MDASKGIAWLTKAANIGYALAQTELGSRYLSGNNVPMDYDRATFWYDKAANQGNARTQYLLAKIYHEKIDDLEKARYWYEKAARQGYRPAKVELEDLED